MPLLETRGSSSSLSYGLNSGGLDYVRDGLILYYDAAVGTSLNQNIFPNPLDPYAWFAKDTPNGNNITLSRDLAGGGASGAGGTPMLLQPTGTAGDPHIGSYNGPTWDFGKAEANQKFTISFWAKTNRVGSDITPLVCFGDATSSVFTFANQITSFSTFPTTTWARYSGTVTAPNDSRVSSIQLRLDASEGPAFTTDRQWIDGIQVEAGSTVTALNSASRSTWFDISGYSASRELTLYNTPIQYKGNGSNGYLIFNGSSQYAQSNNMSSLVSGLSDASINIWYKANAQDNDGMVYDFCNSNGNRDNFSMRQNWGGGNTAAYTTNSSNTFSSVNFETAQYSVWRNYTAIRRGSSYISFINGVQTGNSTGISGVIRDTNRLILGQDNINTNFLNANFGVFQVYNRSITDSEVVKNYNYFKNRYI